MAWTRKRATDIINNLKEELTNFELVIHFDDLCHRIGLSETEFNNNIEHYKDIYEKDISAIKRDITDKLWKYAIRHPQSSAMILNILKIYHNISLDGIVETIDNAKIEITRNIIQKNET